jgi:prepilin-type N-terminal cleavage/methylation domain-containing protein
LRNRSAFTLIELLIVVAIIAILAAVAVPNFLEAQVRAKVSRARNDLRTIAVALESYRVDSNNYPPDAVVWPDHYPVLFWLTTPVAYMSSVPPEVFRAKNLEKKELAADYKYVSPFWKRSILAGRSNYSPEQQARMQDTPYQWALVSWGPDLIQNHGEDALFGVEFMLGQKNCFYDPSNGTLSRGDIVRLGP